MTGLPVLFSEKGGNIYPLLPYLKKTPFPDDFIVCSPEVRIIFMKKKLQQILVTLAAIILQPFFSGPTMAQAPAHVLVGYFQNWNQENAPYIRLDQADARYNVIDVAFAVPAAGTDYQMQFIPGQATPAEFISRVQTLHEQGRTVLISLGGAGVTISLDDTAERDTFVVSVMRILDTYGFDGIDIDFEGASLTLSGGTIAVPVDPPVIHLIRAIKEIMKRFYEKNHRRMVLTMAPETAFVQGGQTSYNGFWGAYLPVIDALRDSIEVLHVQLYNSGTMYGIDGQVYTQGTADFIVAMTEAVIRGFQTDGGWFTGLPAEKIAVGLTACELQSDAGFTDTATVRAAIDYLRGKGPRPGTYLLANPGGYPDLRGMMTWSINWDAIAGCGGSYEYASNYKRLFGNITAAPAIQLPCGIISVYPNPAKDLIHIKIERCTTTPLHAQLYNTLGEMVLSQPLAAPEETINISALPEGVYYLRIGTFCRMVIKY